MRPVVSIGAQNFETLRNKKMVTCPMLSVDIIRELVIKIAVMTVTICIGLWCE